jgi:ankyrin repeat protein
MWNENETIFKELVSLGADPNISDCEGETVLDECATRTTFLALLNESSPLDVSMSETQF